MADVAKTKLKQNVIIGIASAVGIIGALLAVVGIAMKSTGQEVHGKLLSVSDGKWIIEYFFSDKLLRTDPFTSTESGLQENQMVTMFLQKGVGTRTMPDQTTTTILLAVGLVMMFAVIGAVIWDAWRKRKEAPYKVEG